MRISGLVVVAVLGAAAPSGGTAQAPRAPHLTDATFGGSLWVPKGFRVTEYAKVSRARFMALGPTGAVYVSQSRDGQVVRLLDAEPEHTGKRRLSNPF